MVPEVRDRLAFAEPQTADVQHKPDELHSASLSRANALTHRIIFCSRTVLNPR